MSNSDLDELSGFVGGGIRCFSASALAAAINRGGVSEHVRGVYTGAGGENGAVGSAED